MSLKVVPNSVDLDKYLDIQTIPLLLAYPTSFLASNFIFDKQNNIDLPLYHVLFLTVLVIPIFLGSVSSLVYTLMTANKVIRKKESSFWKSNKVLLAYFGLYSAAWILGSVRTVMLSLVLIMNVNLPFLLVSFSFDVFALYVKDKLYLFSFELSKLNFYFILGAYLTLYLINDTIRNVHMLTVGNNIICASVTSILSGIFLIIEYQKLHLSMIFVTIGCVFVLNISKLDLQHNEFKKGSITFMSIISILLEILSLNSNYTQHYFLTFCEFSLITSTFFIEVDEDLFNNKEIHPVDEINIFQQLYSHEDTRAIFSFLLLNTSFMFVQFVYSFRSKSLGLLSDSLHMALDCTSLALGLVAGILAKRPPSESFPFGLTKIETLAGFANGVLLIGIVAGIIIEAIERLINPVNLERTGELLVVSILGFLVNIVGIFAFNHGGEHGGHSHGHSHSHGAHCSEGSNENMQGIFLHILADTLGSAGVVVSTLLTSFFKSNLFDPMASLFIAAMIFISAIPLIKSSAANLLLNLDESKDEKIRDILSQIATTPGIIGYTTPRFWNSPGIVNSDASIHGHSHSVEIKHDHSHEKEHSHEHSHTEKETALHHEHDHSHKDGICEGEEQNFDMVGFIHIQYLEGENSTIIKKRVQKIFENNDIKAIIQVESENSNCWCRQPTT